MLHDFSERARHNKPTAANGSKVVCRVIMAVCSPSAEWGRSPSLGSVLDFVVQPERCEI